MSYTTHIKMAELSIRHYRLCVYGARRSDLRSRKCGLQTREDLSFFFSLHALFSGNNGLQFENCLWPKVYTFNSALHTNTKKHA